MKKIVFIVLVLLAAGLIYWKKPVNKPITPPAKKISPFDHIVLIVMENKTYGEIVGNPQAPYINSLIKNGALAANYWATAHPSLPNYLDLTSGTHGDINSDCNPPSSGCHLAVRNIADELEKAGKSWKAYMENMPDNCGLTNTGLYADKHNPFIYYDNIRNNVTRCREHDLSLTQLENDLPIFSFISPNLCHDMHDCSVAAGDKWLSQFIPPILQSAAFTKEKSLLIITWDEGSDFDNHTPAIFIGNQAKKGYRSNIRYNHYSLLRTVEYLLNLNPLTGNDKNALIMFELLK